MKALSIVESQFQDFSFFTWTRYQKITWISGWDSPNVSEHFAKFGGDRYCQSSDIVFFFFWSCDHKIKRLGSFHCKLPPCQVWWPHVPCNFWHRICSFATWSHDQKVTWLIMWGLLTVSYHPARFDSHRYCESADLGFLNLSRDHVVKKSRDFEGWVPPPQVTTMPNLEAIDIVEVPI